MTMQDPIADMFSRIANAQRVSHKTVVMPSSKIKIAIAEVLKDEGYIVDYQIDVTAEGGDKKPRLLIMLKYYGGKPVIERITRISSPGLRHYVNVKELPVVRGGLGIAIVTTSAGVMTAHQARMKRCGGEVLGYVE